MNESPAPAAGNSVDICVGQSESAEPTQNQQDSGPGRKSTLTVVATGLIVAIMGLGAVFGAAPSAHSESSQTREAIPYTTVGAVAAPHLVGARAGSPAQAQPNSDSVVRAYFDAINSGEFVAAWALGGKNVAGVGYSSFVAGFSATANDDVTINGVTGNTVDVQLDATQADGSHRFFSGTYTVQDGVIVAANIHRD